MDNTISPYIHKYRDHAAYVTKYNELKNKNYGTISVDSVIRNFSTLDNFDSFKQGMKIKSGKSTLAQAKEFFRDFGKILEDKLVNPKSTDLCFENGKQFFSSRKKGVNFNSMATINQTVNELEKVIRQTNEFIMSLNNFLDCGDLIALVGRTAIEELVTSSIVTNYELVTTLRKKIQNRTDGVVVEVLDNVENIRLKNLISQRETLLKLLNETRIGITPPNNIIEHAVCSYYFFAGILSGAIEEIQVAKAVEELDEEIIKKFFNTSIFQVERVGGKRVTNDSGVKRVSKGDVKIDFLNEQNAIISTILLSVKATGQNVKERASSIMIQSKTPLKKFVEGKVSRYAEQGLLNILLHGWRGVDAKGGLGEARYTNKDKQRLLQHISRANAILALAGDARFNQGGYVDYFVVNRKVYTMYDLLERVSKDWNTSFFETALKKSDSKDGSLTAIAKERLKAKTGEQEAASESARQKILNLHFEIKLKLNLLRL